ncbi:MAG: glycosyltransferase family 4 protein [Parvibaculaceae bacterium]|nr:glycosyltransferase family 4 protein [Parvibaculaceae bacterium]
MKIAMIADAFPPMRTSAAVQMRDLSCELLRQKHEPVVLVPDPEITSRTLQQVVNGVHVIRFRTPKTKDVSYVRRTVSELLLPYLMAFYILLDVPSHRTWDGVIWYSPTIFFGPLIRFLKWRANLRSYLILRDIFPEWAVNVGLMNRGLPYFFFKLIERRQYLAADVVGVQAASEVQYVEDIVGKHRPSTEVLQNWLADAPASAPCSLKLTPTDGSRTIRFVYAGNMGKAQNADLFLDLADHLSSRGDNSFFFVGRGSEANRLKKTATTKKLESVTFHDEIPPDEIPGLLAQCDIGIVSLDTRLKTHNIPGKFLTYMKAGIPVLARVNEGNDLIEIIRSQAVGTVVCTDSLSELVRAAIELLKLRNEDPDLTTRCEQTSEKYFSVRNAAQQIVGGLGR